MTLSTLLEKLRTDFPATKPWHIHYAVRAGHVPRPDTDGAGNAVYEQVHFDILWWRMGKKKELQANSFIKEHLDKATAQDGPRQDAPAR